MEAKTSNGMMRKLEDAYIVSAVRTPMGGFRKSLKNCSPVFLGTVVAEEAIRRAGISANEIDETMVGCVLTACHGQNIARQISVNAGIPVISPSVTVNKVCSSSMKAIIMATQAVQLGYRDVVLAAGTESMSSAYYGIPRSDVDGASNSVVDSLFMDGLSDAFSKLKMGVCAEKTATEYSVTRDDQDEYALESYRRAQHAWKERLFSEEVVPVKCPDSTEVCEDEEYKKLNPLKVPHLKPAFVSDVGTITAANASAISDGAAALIIGGGTYLARRGCRPMAQIIGYTEVGLEPMDFTRAPSVAAKKLLAKTGLSMEQISLWEVNEAFAVTAIIFIRDMGLSNADRVNVRGGAVALGHPIGASGARIVVTLLHALHPNQIGIATICNGGGEATAIAVKRL